MIKGSLSVNKNQTRQTSWLLAQNGRNYFYNVINVNYIETVANAEIIS